MSRVPVIHIGMPKTATTTLQWRLFANHSEVFYLGRFDGPHFDNKYLRLDCCRDKAVQKLMQQIAYDNVFYADLPACREQLRQILEPAGEENLLPVWSWESYSTDILSKRRFRAKNLKEVFAEAKIIMTIRKPMALLESAYFEQLKRDNVYRASKFSDRPYYRSIDDWLRENYEGEIFPHLQYAETIQAYVDLFGKDNVHVLLFEELIADPERYFKKICRIMSVDEEEGLRLLQGSKDNSRWTTHQIETLKKFRSSTAQSLIFKCAGRGMRNRLLGLSEKGIPVVGEKVAKAPIPKEWREKIRAVVHPGDLWLEELFELPLKEYGYYNSGGGE